MKKIMLISLILFGLVLPIGFVVSQNVVPPIAYPPPANLPQQNVLAVVQTFLNYLFALLIVAAVISIVISAYLFLTSGGDPERVATARNWVIYAVVAIIVAGLAYGLVAIARYIVGG